MLMVLLMVLLMDITATYHILLLKTTANRTKVRMEPQIPKCVSHVQ